ncbi:extracellular solute-binding protein [Haloferax sp. KTX1]|uniref:extracellular solute-binding protein n=1 Tax=Haloferax sp. KTX1 TaxID=2600597 RepID=UPI0016524809|nr:extracellular solute-binding protein [Haloferax sp. KTX1]
MPNSDIRDSGERSTKTGRRVTRRNWIQMAGATGVAALAGCSGGGDGGNGGSNDGSGDGATAGGDGGMTTIEYWRWPHSTEPSNTGEDEIVQAFNEGPGAEQNIRVEQVTNPFNDHNQALRTAIGGNDAPAIAWTFPAQLYDYSGKDRSTIEENAPFAFVDQYMEDSFRNQFWQPFWDWQESRFGGLVGVPFISAIQPGLMYVNVDAWEAAGLGELPQDSWSYEEYLNAAEQIDGTEVNGTSVNGVGVGLGDAVSAAQWDAYLEQLSRTAGSLIGSGYLNEDDEYTLTLASDPEVEAWNTFCGIPIANGWTNNPGAYTRDGIQDPFSAGQIGLLPHATFSRVEFSQADVNFEIIPFPTKDGNDNMPVYGAGGWEVMFSAFSENVGGQPEEAWEFIKFRNNARNQYNWFNTSSQTVPNQEAYQIMQDEGVSDFVESSGGLDVMDRTNEAMNQYAAQQEAIKSRYPDIKVTEAGSPVTTAPKLVGSGRVHEAVGGALQRLNQNGNQNVEQIFTDAENTWADLIADSDDAAFAESSRGYNNPTPGASPL